MPEELKGTDWGEGPCTNEEEILLIGSSIEMRRFRQPNNKVILVEHGAGQVYLDDKSHSNSDGIRGYENVIGYICPNEAVAERRRANFPGIPVINAGCPKLDKYHIQKDTHIPTRSVVFTFHWRSPTSQEAQTLFDAYGRQIPEIIGQFRNQGYEIFGHWHPRIPELKTFWKSWGVETLESELDVFEKGYVLIADNTSLQAEWMSLGRPQIFLNNKRYRKEVHHGGRFWEWPVGQVSVDGPAELFNIQLDRLPTPTWSPYEFTDGQASKRAANFIIQVLNN